MTVHMRLDGSWATCHATQRACPRRFHMADVTLAGVRAMPLALLEPLLEAMDPPDYTRFGPMGYRYWYGHPDPETGLHRDHDLPAAVNAEGWRAWYRNGLQHRDGGKPAVIYPDGSLEYWVDGRRVPEPAA